MSELILDVRLDGFDDPVGILARDVYGELAFRYTEDYLAKPSALRLSVSLPLTDKSYVDSSCRAFFGNLLQERSEPVENVMRREGIEFSDIAGLLFHLGRDCPGAISVLPRGSPPAKVPGDLLEDYVALTDRQIEDLVVALHTRERLPEHITDPSPIAGVQGKIALTLLPSGQLAQPVAGSGAPTTHILKVSGRHRTSETNLEAAALILSRGAGMQTADALELQVAGINTLLVDRYDRALNAKGQIIRLHQEDFAQALGLPADMKYERNGRENLRFGAHALAQIIDQVADPMALRQFVIQATLFDLLIGNNDAHAKNFSLLFRNDGEVAIAPRYDLVPIRLFDAYTNDLAYRIGNATTIEEITAKDFDDFLQIIGIAGQPSRQRLRKEGLAFLAEYLANNLALLTKTGFKPFSDLIATNIRLLCHAFEVAAPVQARERDAFIGRAGGWLMS